ncbi:MAG: 4Fe-4S binding protein [Methanomicrobiales archaeon]|nr:4Fe-4S binding protein [Methanomicrobiales archaeon]MDI6875846.1 4Fe-4S binding protein [Methanomicrobiales archaeon]
MPLEVGCVARPGRARENITGSWRVFRPVVDVEKCTRCGLCQLICPESAVEKRDEEYVVNLDYCKGCGLCAAECPGEAVEMAREEK